MQGSSGDGDGDGEADDDALVALVRDGDAKGLRESVAIALDVTLAAPDHDADTEALVDVLTVATTLMLDERLTTARVALVDNVPDSVRVRV